MTKLELVAKLDSLELPDEETKKRVVCAMLGHSKIQATFFGYYYCGRCGVQVGDTLGSVYNTTHIVIVGHNCDTCQRNFKALRWQDKFLAPDPFAKEETTP